ncbi:U3 small nucleolar RNA-associated protein 15-like [Holothuria leucospilota]|uniref:U3 small nucleolar RNA-associated protein 15 homolog n=1 Tax=Holothuria leucospilota TaxID=206669 RepID=A0A9Q1H1I9_HOLLE|nr:U3 small nucleolar RNA-associated protein 15-like [Holothuria leucospilota]
MGDFKRTVIRELPERKGEISPESKFWSDFEFPVTVKEFDAITHLEFSPIEPYQFAATTSNKVRLFNPINNQVDRTFSRFKEKAYCGSFRHDGRLMVAGGEECVIKLLDISGRAILRFFSGHERPVHLSKFTSDGLKIFSGADDTTVRCWDISSGEEVQQFQEFKDHVRCGDANKPSRDIILTGSYDHTARLFDLRTNSSIMNVNHGKPIESATFLPSGNIFLTAGGNYVKVWDALAGGRLLTTFGNSHKTITSLWLHESMGRILTGSLDMHVKVYDASTFGLVASLDYPAPVLCVAVSPVTNLLVAGMSTGLLSIKHKKKDETPQTEAERQQKQREKRLALRYFNKGNMYIPQEGDTLVPLKEREGLPKYDRMLQRFEHSKALDQAFAIGVRIPKPHVTFSVLQELIRRDTLKAALSGRNEKWIRLMLHFLKKHISNPNFVSTVTDVVDIILDVYEPVIGGSEELKKGFTTLRDSIEKELKYHQELEEIQGMLDAILIASQTDLDTNPDMVIAERDDILKASKEDMKTEAENALKR